MVPTGFMKASCLMAEELQLVLPEKTSPPLQTSETPATRSSAASQAIQAVSNQLQHMQPATGGAGVTPHRRWAPWDSQA